MKDEIKEMSKIELFLLDLKCSTEPTLTEKGKDLLLDYITNLQEDLKYQEEMQQEINILNYKINKLDEYLHKMLNATKGKYHQAIQETIWFLNMLKEYKGD